MMVTLEETKLILHCWITWKFRPLGVDTSIPLIDSFLDAHSIIQSRLIAGGQDTTEGRQTVFFTAVNPMTDSQEDDLFDVVKPRKVPYKTKWKVFQDAVCWINLKSVQDKGLAFWQTRSNSAVGHDSVSAEYQNWRDSVSEDFLISASTTKNHSEGYPASSTRRLSSAWNQ